MIVLSCVCDRTWEVSDAFAFDNSDAVVVSLPRETFYSFGASVKAWFLFLQKFTEEGAAGFAARREEIKAKIDAEYAEEIANETKRLEAEIEAAQTAKNAKKRKTAQRKPADYLKRMEETRSRESRALLKKQFDHPVFLSDAEKIGIAATGEAGAGELYPNANLPAGMESEDTCLELYRRFRANPEAFALAGDRA